MTAAWWMVTRLILWFYTQSLKWTNYTHIKTVTHVSPLWYLGIMSRRKGKTSLTRQILKIKVMRKSRLHWINIRQHSVHGSRKRTTDHFKVTSSRQKVREAVDGFPTDPRHETDETESSVKKMREADVDARIFTGGEKSPRSPATTGKGQKHPAPESNRRSSAAVHQKRRTGVKQSKKLNAVNMLNAKINSMKCVCSIVIKLPLHEHTYLQLHPIFSSTYLNL